MQLPLNSDDVPSAADGKSQSESQARLSIQDTANPHSGPGVRVGLEAGGGAPSTDSAGAMNVDGPHGDTGINGSTTSVGVGQVSESQSKVASNTNTPVVQNDPEVVARIRQRLAASNGVGV